jgi:hypothetical protein
MKVGGGLNYVTGPMGAGKSLYGVRRIVDAVTSGRYVVTNVELHADAFDRIASHVQRFVPARRARGLSERLAAHYVYETDLTEARRYRLPGKGEARGIFCWDETHNDLNNRSWKDDGRAQTLEWATQLRKLGYVGFLLSQHTDNTDAALRRVCNFVVRLQNQREQTRVMGLRVTPLALFLACWYPSNTPLNARQVKPMRVERYFLDWHRHLYDTHGLYHGLAVSDEEHGVINLPAGGRRVAAALPARAGSGREERPGPLVAPSDALETIGAVKPSLNGEKPPMLVEGSSVPSEAFSALRGSPTA